MRRIAFLTLVVLFVGATAATAQPTVAVRGNVGAAFFRSPEGLSSVLNSGSGVGLGMRVEMYEGLQFLVDGSYDQFTLNGDNVALYDRELQVGEMSRVEGGTYRFLSATASLRYVFPNEGSAHPYFMGGLGIYETTISETRTYRQGQLISRDESRSLTSFGLHLAVGVDFEINDTYTFFFEPRYVVVDTNKQDFGIGALARYVPVQLGLDVRL